MKIYIKKSPIRSQEYITEDGELVHNSYGTTVFEEDNDPVFSGILDSDGQPIYYMTTKNRIGF